MSLISKTEIVAGKLKGLWKKNIFKEPNFNYSHYVFFSQLRSPGIVTNLKGKNKTLYMNTVKSIEAATKANLKKTLKGMLVFAKNPFSDRFNITLEERQSYGKIFFFCE